MAQLEQLLKDKDFLDDAVLAQCETLADDFNGVENSQVRKYFNDIKVLKRMIESGEADWNFIKIRLRLFLAQLAYAEKRSGSSVTSRFRRFFKVCLTKILQDNSQEDNFQSVVRFAAFLEMVYAYYYAKPGRKG